MWRYICPVTRLRELAEQETDQSAKEMYDCMLRNVSLAAKSHRPLCQDTGVLQFFIDVGTHFPYIDILSECVENATIFATRATPLRPNVVLPLSEINTGNNVGAGAPFVEWNVIPNSDKCNIGLYLAGGGCSLPGRSKVLMPLEGIKGVKDYVSSTILEWGVNACPPLFVGVGLSTCAATAAMLSKKAILRPIGTNNSCDAVARLESELALELNSMGIAPLGFGGRNSVLAVHVEAAAHHPATLGVGITTGCWATRRGTLCLDADMSWCIPTHDII